MEPFQVQKILKSWPTSRISEIYAAIQTVTTVVRDTASCRYLVIVSPRITTNLSLIRRKYSNKPPRVRFVGLFDTVKRVSILREFSIFDEKRIEVVRHAMALNENRFACDILPVRTKGNTQHIGPSRSIIEAWFIGSHQDIGGAALHDGLSLYPLQWILYEAEASGLVLGHDPEQARDIISDPLQLVFPGQYSAQNTPESSKDGITQWTFRYSNELEISMFDIRAVHRVVDLKAKKQKLRKGSATVPSHTHNVHLNTGAFDSLRLGVRGPFGEELGQLNGYDPKCKFSKNHLFRN